MLKAPPNATTHKTTNFDCTFFQLRNLAAAEAATMTATTTAAATISASLPLASVCAIKTRPPMPTIYVQKRVRLLITAYVAPQGAFKHMENPPAAERGGPQCLFRGPQRINAFQPSKEEISSPHRRSLQFSPNVPLIEI